MKEGERERERKKGKKEIGKAKSAHLSRVT